MSSNPNLEDQLEDSGRPQAAFPVWVLAPVVALIVVLTLLLFWLLLPGTRLFPSVPTSQFISDAEGLAITEEVNRSLEEQIIRLESALDNAQCTATGELLLPDGRRPDGLLPESQVVDGDDDSIVPSALPDSVLPPSPEQITVPTTTLGDGDATQPRTTLLELMDAQTALVIGVGDVVTTGSGFFIGPDLLVTNYHVVAGESASDAKIFVTSEALAQAFPAQVISSSGPFLEVGADFALLRVEGVQQPYYTLGRSSQTLRLHNVIAAGYPDAILETDSNYRRLIDEGDLTSLPVLAVTNGIVNAEQDLKSFSARILIHTATISQGNSGGPLVDVCGRVVGVNTFVRSTDSRTLNYALASTDLLRFLEGTPAEPASTDAPCIPTAKEASDGRGS